MTEELAYHLKHASQSLVQVQRDIQNMRAAQKEKDAQIKESAFINAALRQLCKEHAPGDLDLQGAISKRVRHLTLMHAIGETHKINALRPLKPEEELEIWTAIEAQAHAYIQRLKEKPDAAS